MDRRWAPLLLGSVVLALSSCGKGGGSQGRDSQSQTRSTTPRAVAEATSIDFANPANYSAPSLPRHFDETVAALDNSPRRSGQDDKVATLGRVLFYDLRLSTNNRASCASCHQQRLGFSDSMQFSNGISGAVTTDFHAMRLGNLRYWRPGTMFWDRRASSLEAQTSQPLHSLVELGWGGAAGGMDALIRKMSGTAYYPHLFAWAFGSPTFTERRMQQALATFVRAMVSSSTSWDRGYAKVYSPASRRRGLEVPLANFTVEENRGRHLFMMPIGQGGAGCAGCHVPPTFALAVDAHSNGLDRGEERLFKAPSLRNVGLTGPYMHDGRFQTLAEVVAFYDNGIQDGPALDDRLRQYGKPRRLGLSAADRAAIVAFLKTLNDPVLTTDPRFGDPFRR